MLTAPATNLAADAPATAIAVAARPGDCDHVELWNWQTNRSVRLGPSTVALEPATRPRLAADLDELLAGAR